MTAYTFYLKILHTLLCEDLVSFFFVHETIPVCMLDRLDIERRSFPTVKVTFHTSNFFNRS